MSDLLTLHGIKVPAADYAKLKTLASVFYGETKSDLPEPAAWRAAVEYAVQVLQDWRGEE